MPLDCLRAFAISDDHKQQEKIWKDLPAWSKGDADSIRDTLTEAQIDAGCKLARSVTRAARFGCHGPLLCGPLSRSSARVTRLIF